MGVIGLHMSGSSLDTAALQDFNHQQLMTLFKLDSHVEEASGIPGVTMSKPVRIPQLPNQGTTPLMHLAQLHVMFD